MAYGGVRAVITTTDFPEKELEFKGTLNLYKKGSYWMEHCEIWDENNMQPEYDDNLKCIINLNADAKREEKQLLKRYGVTTIDEVDEDDYEECESELGEIIHANMEGNQCRLVNESNGAVHKARIKEFIVEHD